MNKKESSNAIKKILVIRFRRIGDAVLSSAICSSLKQSFPDAEVHFVLNENIAPLFTNHPDIDKIITFSDTESKNIPVYLSKIWQIMHSNKYDLIVDCRSTIKTLFFSLFSLSTPYRLGLIKSYNFISNFKTDIRIFESNVDKMVGLLSPLAPKFNLKLTTQFKLAITKEEEIAYRSYMTQEGINFSKPVIVCTIAARLSYKMWNINYMADVLTQIIQKYDAQLIFNYVGDELKTAQKIKEIMGNPCQIFLNIEAKSLRELCALIINSDFLFGNEGGPRHISQAFGIPSFAIYPPNIPKKEWLPNASPKFQGIEPQDILKDLKNSNLNYIDTFNLITPYHVSEKLFPMLETYLNKAFSEPQRDQT